MSDVGLCPYCQTRPVSTKRHGKTCGVRDCVRAHRKHNQRQAWQRYNAQRKAANAARLAARTCVVCAQPLPGLSGNRRYCSDTCKVHAYQMEAPPTTARAVVTLEARLAVARAARIAARKAGDPYWHIDPWQQRPGAGTVNDGDPQGGGWS
jgi:hypothetical protein